MQSRVWETENPRKLSSFQCKQSSKAVNNREVGHSHSSVQLYSPIVKNLFIKILQSLTLRKIFSSIQQLNNLYSGWGWPHKGTIFMAFNFVDALGRGIWQENTWWTIFTSKNLKKNIFFQVFWKSFLLNFQRKVFLQKCKKVFFSKFSFKKVPTTDVQQPKSRSSQ